ncbi:MAG: non-canonical purine NTP pyrophosphatase, RdgB/HAM1 family [Candidatus Neomarinimicrobiota bacterium]|nr:RdgB/HAM1 family non-canonical purine NTP pyrophosphatase [Candidatus Neomarinimicrobiota bacterium]RKY47341.1 MAG: non-canonical purine NTP pyrophosphatase, RdgB/HAM1 family [Candidatus Neomarinimicrobiota bacterium]
MKLVLATHNRDKVSELKAVLKSEQISILTCDDFPAMPEIIEDGDTLEENALKKARGIHQYTKLPVLADDTGLEVPALKGAPGVMSSRYAGDQASYADNVAKLLKEMAHIPMEQREARFRTVMVYLDDRNKIITEGDVSGQILEDVRGRGGFGYDPVFYYPPFNKTFSEMTLSEKNRISHRGQALLKMIKALRENHILKEV